VQLRLAGKTVLVTGGLRGIGKSISVACGRAGAEVIATYVSSSNAAAETCRAIAEQGIKIYSYHMDVRSTDSVSQAVAEIEKNHGTVSVLINNSGIVKDNLVLSMDDGEWADVIDTNLTGSFHVIRAVARQMVRQRAGSIVNISSVAGSRPGRGQANYAASKGGIEAMTKALAVEFASKNIRVNAVAPGVIETEMSREVREAAGDKILDSILLKKFGAPEDIAAAVLFLASDAARYVTGEILHVDGGLKL